MLRRSGVRRCGYRINALGRVKALFEIGVEGKLGGGSGGGGITPSTRALEVKPVSVVWPETTATSACVGKVKAAELSAQEIVSAVDSIARFRPCFRPRVACFIGKGIWLHVEPARGHQSEPGTPLGTFQRERG
jgi:hypothetical protein